MSIKRESTSSTSQGAPKDGGIFFCIYMYYEQVFYFTFTEMESSKLLKSSVFFLFTKNHALAIFPCQPIQTGHRTMGHLKTEIPRWQRIITVVIIQLFIWLDLLLPKFRQVINCISDRQGDGLLAWETQRTPTGCQPGLGNRWALSTLLLFCSVHLKLCVRHVSGLHHPVRIKNNLKGAMMMFAAAGFTSHCFKDFKRAKAI